MKPGALKSFDFSKVRQQRDEKHLALTLTLDALWAADPHVTYLIFLLSLKSCVLSMPKSKVNQITANAGKVPRARTQAATGRCGLGPAVLFPQCIAGSFHDPPWPSLLISKIHRGYLQHKSLSRMSNLAFACQFKHL